MTNLESSKLIGKSGYVRVQSMSFEVVIKDVKNSYGNTRYLVRPVGGTGESWVEKLEIGKE